jgi:hypothetical protein
MIRAARTGQVQIRIFHGLQYSSWASAWGRVLLLFHLFILSLIRNPRSNLYKSSPYHHHPFSFFFLLNLISASPTSLRIISPAVLWNIKINVLLILHLHFNSNVDARHRVHGLCIVHNFFESNSSKRLRHKPLFTGNVPNSNLPLQHQQSRRDMSWHPQGQLVTCTDYLKSTFVNMLIADWLQSRWVFSHRGVLLS